MGVFFDLMIPASFGGFFLVQFPEDGLEGLGGFEVALGLYIR
ncbi:MAG: hypothetical protein ACJAQT_001557 [Akkermansiaceae bacterium]|jgi:hypothetical protein